MMMVIGNGNVNVKIVRIVNSDRLFSCDFFQLCGGAARSEEHLDRGSDGEKKWQGPVSSLKSEPKSIPCKCPGPMPCHWSLWSSINFTFYWGKWGSLMGQENGGGSSLGQWLFCNQSVIGMLTEHISSNLTLNWTFGQAFRRAPWAGPVQNTTL